MKNFYLTFGQKSPFRNNWVLVVAENYNNARKEVIYIFGQFWSFLYEEEKFDKSFFPEGQVGKTVYAGSYDDDETAEVSNKDIIGG